MQAIGLLETRGLIAAIEASDAMVKSADVRLLEKSKVGGGLITITVTGDVGAVKASIEAGSAAVRNLGDNFLVSEHVIPRPSNELENIMETKSIQEREEEKQKNSKVIEAKIEVIEEVKEEDTIEELKAEEIVKAKEILNQDNINKEYIDALVKEEGLENALELLSNLKVVKLRNLAREYEDFKISGRVVSKANKDVLIENFKEYYK